MLNLYHPTKIISFLLFSIRALYKETGRFSFFLIKSLLFPTANELSKNVHYNFPNSLEDIGQSLRKNNSPNNQC